MATQPWHDELLFVGRAPGGGRGHQGEHCVLARVTPTVLANAHSDAFKMIDPPIQACKVQHLTKGVALRMAEAEAVSEQQLGRAARHRSHLALHQSYLTGIPMEVSR